MATLRVFQQTFNGGLMSPSMLGRISDPKYQTGLAVAKNVLIEPQGPVRNRPGFVYVNKTKTQTAPCRLIPFVYNNDQTMVLEFGDCYIRFHTQGQTLLDDDDEPYEIETPYDVDDVMDIHYVQSADVMTLVHPAYAPMELKRYGATDWRLEEIEFNEQLDAPVLTSVVQSINDDVSNPEDYTREYGVTALLEDGTQESVLSNTIEIDCNPYGDGAYNTITWESVDGAELYRVYRNQGGVYAYIGQTSGTSIIDENLDPDASICPPYYSTPFANDGGITSVTITSGGSGYSATNGISDIATTPYKKYQVSTFMNASSSKRSADSVTVTFSESDLIKIESFNSSGSPKSTDSVSGSGADISGTAVLNDSGVSITSLTITSGGADYESNDYLRLKFTYKIYEYIDGDGESSGYYGWQSYTAQACFKLTLAASSTTATVTDSTGSGAELSATVDDGVVTAIKVIKQGSGYTSPTIKIVDSNGSGAKATATVSDGSDYPSAVAYYEQRRIFAGTYNYPLAVWMTYSGTESDFRYSLPTTDADRIEKKIFAQCASRIAHVVPLSSLMLVSGDQVWTCTTVNDDAITNDSLCAKMQSSTGASNVQPVTANSVMIYAAARGGHLQECGYNWQAGGFISQDISLRAPSLFDNYEIVDMAISRAPWQIVWAVSSAGNLIAMTYVPEQSVGAFSSIETDGTFCSCCAVAEGTEDRLYCVIKRTIEDEDVYFIERMYQLQYESLETCCYLDCAGWYDSGHTEEITGLDWLEGREVSIFADGSVLPSQTVEDGTVALTEESSVAFVGLAYNSDIQTLPPAVALQDGSYGNSRQKNVQRVTVRVVDSSGLFAGPSFDKLTEYPARSTELAGSPPDVTTGAVSWAVNPRWSQDGTICLRQSYPLPMRIVTLTTTIEIV